MRIGVIGAGMAGLTCARTLVRAGHEVRLFDKSRGVGGRIATRRTQSGAFDHGAFGFGVSHGSFREAVEEWIAQGTVARWNVPFARVDEEATWHAYEPAASVYVGSPSMNAPARALAEHLPFERGFRVVELDRSGAGIRLRAEDGRVSDAFDRAVLALPAPQARELLPGELANRLDDVRMAPCWTLCLLYERPLDIPYGAAWFEDEVLASMARSRLRPGRGPEEWVTLHATGSWSEPRILGSEEEAREALLTAWRRHLKVPEPPLKELVVHRWRYALTTRALGTATMFDQQNGLGVCGDWCLGAGLEAAYLSGRELAQRISSR